MDLPMDAMAYYLPVVWAVLIATAVMMYVVLDGFDLGIGILFPFARKDGDRDTMINTIAPFWDGNETWLILGGGGLWVAFPAAYAAIMPANYLPVIIMLLALIFRGVSFEFRVVSKPRHAAWDLAFSGGSTVAAFAQGVILGNLIQGIDLDNGAFAGSAFDWLTPFTLMCGVGLVLGYALLGATWLIARTDGEIEARSRRQARNLLIGVLVFIAAVSLWTPLGFERIEQRWFSTPNIYFLWLLPAITVVVAYGAWRWIGNGAVVKPFIATILLFLLCYLGLAISTFPYLVPPSMTIWDAAAVPDSQIFSLIGVLVMLPIILGYTVFVYWTFLRHGKVTADAGYH
jgi:cytochrome d ubiquinol oxidase subunit II